MRRVEARTRPAGPSGLGMPRHEMLVVDGPANGRPRNLWLALHGASGRRAPARVNVIPRLDVMSAWNARRRPRSRAAPTVRGRLDAARPPAVPSGPVGLAPRRSRGPSPSGPSVAMLLLDRTGTGRTGTPVRPVSSVTDPAGTRLPGLWIGPHVRRRSVRVRRTARPTGQPAGRSTARLRIRPMSGPRRRAFDKTARTARVARPPVTPTTASNAAGRADRPAGHRARGATPVMGGSRDLRTIGRLVRAQDLRPRPTAGPPIAPNRAPAPTHDPQPSPTTGRRRAVPTDTQAVRHHEALGVWGRPDRGRPRVARPLAPIGAASRQVGARASSSGSTTRVARSGARRRGSRCRTTSTRACWTTRLAASCGRCPRRPLSWSHDTWS